MRYFAAGAELTQRIALGWQAIPMLEQTGASPSAPRVQLTHASVQRAQFGGPFCIDTFSEGGRRAGMSSSAARRLAVATADAVTKANIKAKRRMPLSARCRKPHGIGSGVTACYRHSTLVISYALAPPGAITSTVAPFFLPIS